MDWSAPSEAGRNFAGGNFTTNNISTAGYSLYVQVLTENALANSHQENNTSIQIIQLIQLIEITREARFT
jgi:hypothetical protein